MGRAGGGGIVGACAGRGVVVGCVEGAQDGELGTDVAPGIGGGGGGVRPGKDVRVVRGEVLR